jgi:hypothetical protein
MVRARRNRAFDAADADAADLSGPEADAPGIDTDG